MGALAIPSCDQDTFIRRVQHVRATLGNRPFLPGTLGPSRQE